MVTSMYSRPWNLTDQVSVIFNGSEYEGTVHGWERTRTVIIDQEEVITDKFLVIFDHDGNPKGVWFYDWEIRGR